MAAKKIIGFLLGLFRFAGEIQRDKRVIRSEEHTSELQSRLHLVCRLLLEKKKHTTSQLCSDGSPSRNYYIVAIVLATEVIISDILLLGTAHNVLMTCLLPTHRHILSVLHR